MNDGFVAMSRFAVFNETVDAVKAAFRARPHLVDDAPGFIKMDVISPVDAPEEVWLITYWDDEANFLAWHHSPAHKDSHRQMPRGIKLDPKRSRLQFFTHIAN
ncbi:MAG: antibiotic biosynthesis monooxygenase [Gammaproteobacteria bacterium]